MNQKHYSKTFIIILIINIVCLLSSNIITSKPITFFNLIFTSGDFLFPITYILNDLIVELYGYEKSKFSIRISFISNFIMVMIFLIAIILPYPAYYTEQVAFQTILSFTPRILIASMLAYYFGNLLNSLIMFKIKNINKKQKVWIRTIISSIGGEAVDTIIFITVSFIGKITFRNLLIMILSIYSLKLFIEILFTPLLIFIINKFKKIEGV